MAGSDLSASLVAPGLAPSSGAALGAGAGAAAAAGGLGAAALPGLAPVPEVLVQREAGALVEACERCGRPAVRAALPACACARERDGSGVAQTSVSGASAQRLARRVPTRAVLHLAAAADGVCACLRFVQVCARGAAAGHARGG